MERKKYLTIMVALMVVFCLSLPLHGGLAGAKTIKLKLATFNPPKGMIRNFLSLIVSLFNQKPRLNDSGRGLYFLYTAGYIALHFLLSCE